jgi:hypothetical protein
MSVQSHEARSPTSSGVWLGGLALQIAALLVVAVPLALAVRHGCIDPGPPVDRPVAGTARADYCNAIGGSTPWLLLVLLPVAVVTATSFVVRARSWWAGWISVLIVVAVLGLNALLLLSTDFATTV